MLTPNMTAQKPKHMNMKKKTLVWKNHAKKLSESPRLAELKKEVLTIDEFAFKMTNNKALSANSSPSLYGSTQVSSRDSSISETGSLLTLGDDLVDAADQDDGAANCWSLGNQSLAYLLPVQV
jgi:hypothetical protein